MKKIVSLALCFAMVFVLCSCTVVRRTLFKGKTEAEWNSALADSLHPDLSLIREMDPSAKDYSVRVEGENCVSASVNYSVLDGDEFSSGKILGITSAKSQSRAAVSYKVTVPEAGLYDLTTLCTRLNKAVTTDFLLYVNGELAQKAVKTFTDMGAFNAPSLGSQRGYLRMTGLAPIHLNAGENEISFVLDSDDAYPANSYLFYLDYFDVSVSDIINVAGGPEYTSAPEGEYSSQANAAAKVSVYTNTWDMSLALSFVTFNPPENGKDVLISIRDYSGNVIYTDTVVPLLGESLYRVDLGKHPVGYYTVTAESGGETLYNAVYAVLPDVSARSLPAETPFASDFASYHLLDNAQDAYPYASVCALAGVSWVRERCDWIYTEWGKGGYDFSRPESFYNVIDKAGLKLMPFISNAPNWAKEDGTFMTSQYEIYAYAKKLAQQLGSTVDALEIWNEMDWFTTEPADLYSSFYKAAALGLVDSGVDVSKVVGALCQKPSENDYLEILAENGVFDYSDAFNWHYHIYDRTEQPVTEFVDGTTAGEFLDYANRNLPELPIWCTEAGIKLYIKDNEETLTSDQQKIQANYLVTSAVQSLAAGTDKHFWFISLPFMEDTGAFGSFSMAGEPFPSVVSEAVMTETLGQAAYLGQISGLSDGVEGHVFNNGSDDVLVLWSTNAGDVKIPVAENALSISIMGRKSVLVPSGGELSVHVSEEPVFIMLDGTCPESLYEKTERDATKELGNKTDFTPAQRVVLTQLWDGADLNSARSNGYSVSSSGSTVTVKVLNLNDTEMTGVIRGAADGYIVSGDGNVTVPAFSEVTVSFTVTPLDAGTGNTFIRFTGAFNGELTSVSAAKIHIS